MIVMSGNSRDYAETYNGGAKKMKICPLCASSYVQVLVHKKVEILVCDACGYDSQGISDYYTDIWEFQKTHEKNDNFT